MDAGTQDGAGSGRVTSGDPLSRYPSYLSKPATSGDPLSRYPAYLTTPPPPVERTRSPLVSAVGAYAAAFVAQMLAAIPIGLFIVGGFAPSFASTSAEVHRAAALAAFFTITTFVVVAVVAAWLFLRIRGVRPAFVIGFVGQVVALSWERSVPG